MAEVLLLGGVYILSVYAWHSLHVSPMYHPSPVNPFTAHYGPITQITDADADVNFGFPEALSPLKIASLTSKQAKG